MVQVTENMIRKSAVKGESLLGQLWGCSQSLIHGSCVPWQL